MKKKFTAYLLSCLTFSIIFTAGILPASAAPSNPPYIVEGYYGDWMSQGIGASHIQDLTELNYAFFGVAADGHIYLTSPNNDLGTLIPSYINGIQNPTFNNLPISYAIKAWQTGLLNYPAQGNFPGFNTLADGGKFEEIVNLKRIYPNLKVLFVVGGWTGSQYFSDVAANPEYTKNFIYDVISILQNIRYTKADGSNVPLFDGIDIDWEYPVKGGEKGTIHRDNDGTSYAMLTHKLREAINSTLGKEPHFLITIAVPHGIAQPDGGSISNIDLADMLNPFDSSEPDVDHVNMMAYDYSSGLSQTAFLAPLHYLSMAGSTPNPLHNYTLAHSINQGIKELINAGVPSRSIVLGVPLYVSKWNNVNGNSLVKDSNTSTFQTYGLFSSGTFSDNNTTYSDFIENLLKPIGSIYNNPLVHFNDTADASYYFNPASGTFYSFEGPKDLSEKINTIKKLQLGGMMFWEITGDTNNEYSLIQQARKELLGDTPTPPLDPGSITFTNTSPTGTWQNVSFEQCLNSDCTMSKAVAQASIGTNPANNTPVTLNFKGYYGQNSMIIKIMVTSLGAAKPLAEPCPGSYYTLSPNQTITVKGYQIVTVNQDGSYNYSTVCRASYPPRQR